MPAPVARITLKDERSYRGEFKTAQDLRDWGVPTDGDVAQVYGLKRFYTFDDSSTAADDPGGATGVIQPTGLATGRWICTVENISGYDYTSILLEGTLSDLGDGSSIDLYEWVLVDEPSAGVTPSVILNTLGGEATLKLPIDASWRPGGSFVFLRVTNDLGQQSTNNPFSPLTSPLSSFQIIAATENNGFLVPAAGTRNWHKEYRDTFLSLDSILSLVASDAVTQTRSNKRISPLAGTSGSRSVVSGVALDYTPDADSYVRVSVNGASIPVGDADDAAPCFFADPTDVGANPLTFAAKPIKDLVQGDLFIWNGPTGFPGPGDPPIGYELDIEDVIEIEYQVSFPEPI
jgi:hypothetical protein